MTDDTERLDLDASCPAAPEGSDGQHIVEWMHGSNPAGEWQRARCAGCGRQTDPRYTRRHRLD